METDLLAESSMRDRVAADEGVDGVAAHAEERCSLRHVEHVERVVRRALGNLTGRELAVGFKLARWQGGSGLALHDYAPIAKRASPGASSVNQGCSAQR